MSVSLLFLIIYIVYAKRTVLNIPGNHSYMIPYENEYNTIFSNININQITQRIKQKIEKTKRSIL